MAKKEVIKDEPIMPVEQKHEDHVEAVKRSAYNALSPGRVDPINKGLLGEFEMLIMDAEQNHQHALAAELHNIQNKIGALVIAVKELDKKGMDDLKKMCARVGELFL